MIVCYIIAIILLSFFASAGRDKQTGAVSWFTLRLHSWQLSLSQITGLGLYPKFLIHAAYGSERRAIGLSLTECDKGAGVLVAALRHACAS